ncbi:MULTISPECIES: hypothetical protein [unclassified Thiocapsa]|uniref:hypothetical protein n=1 Tax=unclassified Thiocapsa TaxID=2641286 RepID=UPI0035ADF339
MLGAVQLGIGCVQLGTGTLVQIELGLRLSHSDRQQDRQQHGQKQVQSYHRVLSGKPAIWIRQAASDLLISHDGLACRSGGRSGFCGIRTCLVVLYVRQGGRLSLNTEVLSSGASIGAGDPPAIALTSDDGSPNPLRWNGTTFVER